MMHRIVLFAVSLGCAVGCRENPPDLPGPSTQRELLSEGKARSSCEISYEQTKAMLAANPEAVKSPAVAEQGLPPIELAPRDVFLRECERMPQKVQQCLVFEYAMQHNEECTRARAEYDNARTIVTQDP